MPLVVPVLRLFLLFQNVFETFKILKPPARSHRTGEVSPKAVSQRKRDMKGCMAIWLLWCSCIVIEGLTDNTIGIVMPFYNEIKAVIYLFQILTRARGAEPIYLHVMRPLIKPYVATLDWALDSGHLFGDFIVLLISIPIGMITNWWSPSSHQEETPIKEPDVPLDTSEAAAEEPSLQKPSQMTNGVGLRTRGTRQASNGTSGKPNPSRVTRPNVIHSRSESANLQKQKVWRPPTSAYDDDDPPQRPAERRVVSESDSLAKAIPVKASTAPVVPRPARKPSDSTADELSSPDPVPSAPLQPRAQRVKSKAPSRPAGFWGVARENACESNTNVEDSGSHSNSGDDENLEKRSLYPNVENNVSELNSWDVKEEINDSGDEEPEEEDDDDDEDDFNVTLRTPARMRPTGNWPTRMVTPPPELRILEEDSDQNLENSEKISSQAETDSDRPNMQSKSHLRGPTVYRRANSNYTLSSSRTNSTASFTTASRAGSSRNMSRTSSLASNPSDRVSSSDGDTGLESGSNIGTMRPGTAIGYKKGLTVRTTTTARQPLQPSRSILSNSKGTNVRPIGTARPLKATTLRAKPSMQRVSGQASSPDTVDEFGVLGNDDVQKGTTLPTTNKTRKTLGMNSSTRSNMNVRQDENPFDLTQISEENDSARTPSWI